ncbi:hypothetical protein ABZS66_23795 [Dactylosporangium sp. NPDC005572]|uniref:hypothetical protein n=1 Tax=Dactylosporangium sp. NPDC005572 TaxID=3156889 RepID=UPI0033A848BE
MVPTDSGPFATLLHAYGRATDTPAHLAALAGADAEARAAALSHLWSAVIHQGTPWTVTPPAAEVIVALVAELPPGRPAVRPRGLPRPAMRPPTAA